MGNSSSRYKNCSELGDLGVLEINTRLHYCSGEKGKTKRSFRSMKNNHTISFPSKILIIDLNYFSDCCFKILNF
jgi:hypothetical protein